MTTLHFDVSKQNIFSPDFATVSGSAEIYEAEFTFDASWDGFARTAVFECAGERREQLLVGDRCIVPWEILKAGAYLRVGVYGVDRNKTMPTVYSGQMFVARGAEPSETAREHSADMFEQIVEIGEQAAEAKELWENMSAEAETLPAGTPATASYSGGVLSLGIPGGAPGAQGDKGDKGDKGDTGPQGEQGAQGTAGADGVTPTIGENGNWYLGNTDTGKPSRGVQGPQGPQGNTGATGAAIISTEFIGKDEDGGNIYRQTFDNGETATFTAPKGEVGQRGATGETGPQGPQGETGPQGPKGDKGDTGATGAQGAQGPQGIQGPAGADGADGADGITPHIDETTKHWMIGNTDTGIVAEGQDGADGAKGDKGDKGDTGATGATGATGPQGEQGPQGLQGPQGVAGQSAYTAAQSAGYTGTEAQFNSDLASVGSKINTSEKGAANGVASLGADGKVPKNQVSAQADSFSVTLESTDWINGAQTVSDAKFVQSGYGYIVSPDAGSYLAYASALIYADDVTVSGQMTFHANDVPTADLTVNILRVEVA